MIGLDTSHVPSFTKLLNDSSQEYHVPGGRVTAAYPGGSKDFDLSWGRVTGYTKELRDNFGVEILDSPAAVAEAVDMVFITSVDGRVHLQQFRETVPFKRPTFIDKPLALNTQEAEDIFRIAEKAGIVVTSSSALRFIDLLVDSSAKSDDPVLGCNVFGPMPEQPTQPGLFWYGIHTMEMVVTVMGTGCQEVRVVRTDDADLVTLRYLDGRLASLHGLRNGTNQFGLIIHRAEEGHQCIDITAKPKLRYAGLLKAIMKHLPNGTTPVPPEETLEVIRLLEAANDSRQAEGKTIYIAQ
jgi:hypothetical protein